ncbi:type II CRISPR RNA-guided endonuclease Cas9 [Mucispirillum schaedleri]|uniref:type II CRISPR RNA-guided endonuclease Cas9 n=1 Tax=Mucispirillum schaedleri TaxID=248039 RepID=UPI001F5A3FCC|nr:type II CRISPR RNA-guided endonuclease Cas9 [Mucispirillum schaedleri]
MAEKKFKYRLGLDLGTNSIGWCMLRLNKDNEPAAVIKSGVRIFHDGRNEKTKEPLAVVRRNARSIRRNLDRKISRRNHLLNTLVKYFLLPSNEIERKALAVLNPYELRSRAVNERLELFELGRLLMHLSKRRGFKSNRKVDKKDSNGKIKPAIEKLKDKMQETNKKTAGEYLYSLMQNGKPVRARLGRIDGSNGYEIYLDRALIEEEYNLIMNEQKNHHKELTDDIINEIFNIIFYQRPLKKQIIGKCSLTGEDTKLHKAHVLAQDFILLQKINDLRVYDENIFDNRELTPNEKAVLRAELQTKKEMSFDKIRNLLKKIFTNSKYGKFSHEIIDDEISGNKTNAVMGNKDILGDKWGELSEYDKYNLIDLLVSDSSNDELKEKFRTNFNLTDMEINNILDKAIYKLDIGYLKYGKKAVQKLNGIMSKENIGLSFAIKQSGLTEEKNNNVSNYLEYYGKILQDSVIDPQLNNPKNDEEKYGKIANPTVHAALNQLRKLVNELIKLYGKPEQIVIELARDLKNSRKAKDVINKKIAENRKLNEEVDKILQEYSEEYNTHIVKNKLNRDKVKLWLELGKDPLERKCIYTGEQINIVKLFSDEVQIEHIVPYSKTLDDSFNNKTLSMKYANYYKGNKTPYEAFGENKDGFNYHDILERAKIFNKSKFDRFTKDAMDIYNRDGKDFIARQLSDTQYLSTRALIYLQSLYIEEKHSSIWTIPGQLTALIRNYLGLNTLISNDKNKNRNDHRHHAVDAFVVAVTSRSLLQKISYAASLQEDLDNRNVSSYRNKLLEKMPEPFPNYRKSLELAIDNMKTSHKADRSISGKLHEDTAYGIVENDDKYNVVTRWTVDKFKEQKHFETIRDNELKEIACSDKELFAKIVETRKIKSIRKLAKENPVIKIKDKSGRDYKAFAGGNNICVEIYEVNGVRKSEVIQLFDAAQKEFMPEWMKKYPNGKLLMRLFKGDVIGFIENRKYKYCVIKGINYVANNLKLTPINKIGDEFRIGFKSLFGKDLEKKELNAKQFNISVTGIVTKKKTSDVNFWKNRK